MALILDGVSQKGRFELQFTVAANTAYVLLFPDRVQSFVRYEGYWELARRHLPTASWVQVSGTALWVRAHTIRVEALSAGGGNRMLVTWRRSGVFFELHTFA